MAVQVCRILVADMDGTFLIMKRSTKFGISFVAIRFLVWIAISVSILFGFQDSKTFLIDLGLALDAPIFLALTYLYEASGYPGRLEDILFVAYILIFSPVWLFYMGKLLWISIERLRSAIGASFVGIFCAVCYAVFLYVAAAQLAISRQLILFDGYGSAGYPLVFITDRGFPRITFSTANFAFNSMTWITLGAAIGYAVSLVSNRRLDNREESDRQ